MMTANPSSNAASTTTPTHKVNTHRPWRGTKAQSVGHISAGRHRAGFGVNAKAQTSRAIATAATGVETLRNGSSRVTDDVGMTTIEPESINYHA